MIIEPRVRGFICTTAHPTGCAANVAQQINYVKNKIKAQAFPSRLPNKFNKVLIIGASTGYGLASRIVASFGANAKTIGVFFERSALPDKTGSAGWYNTYAFEQQAHTAGLYAKSINGDAFSDETKQQTIDLIKQDWDGKVDLIIYSLASPRRTVPSENKVYNSVLKPINQFYKDHTVDFATGKVSTVELAPASPEEIEATIKVMGGEDLELWINKLHNAKALSEQCKVVAYSYIGPKMTYPIYRNGTIGKAKEHLEQTINNLNLFLMKQYHGNAVISVNKALVTQASAAIPVVPLYISLLYKVMKSKNIHEGCIEQIFRLFMDHLNTTERIRLDDLELREDVQIEIANLWNIINTENITQISDLAGYKEDFYKLFGFNMPNVDYNQDQNIDLQIPSLIAYA